MDIKRIILSYLDANCYIISIGKKCLIVDPGWDKDVIIREVKDKKVLGILVTHYHPDHVGALEDIIKEYNVNVYNYKSEEKVKLDKYGQEKVSLGKKIFVWAMFIAMFAAFVVPLAIYFIDYALKK